MDIDALHKLLTAGHDNAILRFSLGKAHADREQWEAAITHLQKALEQNPQYSAAWQWLGKSLHQAGRLDEALATLNEGIEVAGEVGDKQAEKVMRVLKRRVLKALDEEEEE